LLLLFKGDETGLAGNETEPTFTLKIIVRNYENASPDKTTLFISVIEACSRTSKI
jgi:hypothetical protein